jgi:predicted metal-binding membrane protein
MAATFGAVSEPRGERAQLGQAFRAARHHMLVVLLLLGVTAAAWFSAVDRMAGMDAGPGTDLGALGWFAGVWVVMMAAMMFPSLAPTATMYARMTRTRGLSRPLLFAAGYLLVWGAAGLLAYGLFRLGRSVLGGDLAWHNAGRYFAGGVLVLAAIYELTPLKEVCLGKCRSSLGFLMGAWREGHYGALEMGAKHAAWCVGCCWALMAGLFALGVMSLTWMGLVAALIALEKVLPWRRVATWGTAGVLLVLGIALMAVPRGVPALVVPGTPGAMHAMRAMHAMPATHGAQTMHGMKATHPMPSTQSMPAMHGTQVMPGMPRMR